MSRYTVRISDLPSPAAIAALGDSMRQQNGIDAPAMRALAAVIDRVSSPRIAGHYVQAAMEEIESIGGTGRTFRTYGQVAIAIELADDSIRYRHAYRSTCNAGRRVSRHADSELRKDRSVSFATYAGSWSPTVSDVMASLV